jgi:hypothetical protein
MKATKLVLAITLSIGISSTNFCSQAPTSSLISWTQSTLYNIYQGMIDSFTGLISIPYSIMSTVSAWSNQQKVFVATAAIASLLAVYQKEVIKRWLTDAIERLTASEETRKLIKDLNIQEIPYHENPEMRQKMIEEALKS